MSRKPIHIDKRELSELCESGMTQFEIAEYLNCSPQTITRRKREFGLIYGRGHTPANKRANHDSSRRDMASFLPIESLEEREAHFVERLANDERTQMYEYVGGYKTKRDKLTIRCRKCGELKVTSPSVLFSNKYDHHVCFNCMRIEREKARKERIAAWKEHEAAELAKDKICEACGSVYHSASDTSKYCSKKCKAKARDHTHRARARKYGVEYDPTINWRTLSKRLGHLNCEICGEPCDPNDMAYGKNGPLYPSVDCIIPMSAGGGYVYGNVQLAHHICNSAVRDLVNEDEIAKAVAKHAPNGGRYRKRHALGTA